MSKWILRAAAVAVAALLAAPAMAQKSYDDRRAEMEAQIDLLRKEKELNEAIRAVAGAGAAPMPSVVSIIGIEGRFTARLIQPNGVVGNYGEGDVVRPGLTVAAITQKAVAVKVGEGKKARTVPLEFMAGATTGTPGMPGTPGLPPGAPGGGVLPPELLPAPPNVMPRLPPAGSPPQAPAAPVAAAPSAGPAPGAGQALAPAPAGAAPTPAPAR